MVGMHEDKLLRFFDHCPHYLKMKEVRRVGREVGKGREDGKRKMGR